MPVTPPLVFCVSELVNVVTDQARDRTPWHLDSVTVSPTGKSADLSLLIDHYPDGLIRLDITVRAGFVAPRAP